MNAEELCKYCGEPIGHLEIYERCPCRLRQPEEDRDVNLGDDGGGAIDGGQIGVGF